jgi:metal-sulfur cluster biosynthetic enzyme
MAADSDEALHAAVLQALRQVIDPELGENLVDLGLIYSVDVERGAARIVMSTTTIGCPAAAYLKDAVASASAASGATDVEVTLTYDPPWTPDLMNPSIRQR